MPHWLGTSLALVAVIGLAFIVGWSFTLGGRRRIRRYTAMGSMLLGLGMVIDPPSQHAVEATQRRVAKGDENGDPPDPQSDEAR